MRFIFISSHQFKDFSDICLLIKTMVHSEFWQLFMTDAQGSANLWNIPIDWLDTELRQLLQCVQLWSQVSSKSIDLVCESQVWGKLGMRNQLTFGQINWMSVINLTKGLWWLSNCNLIPTSAPKKSMWLSPRRRKWKSSIYIYSIQTEWT